MSFRCDRVGLLLGLTGMLFAATAAAQSEPAQVSVPDEAPPAVVTELTDAHAPANPGNPEAGEQKSAVCAACHGIDGNSADAANPRLAAQHERYIARQLALFATGERPSTVMMAFAAPLSAQDMRDLGAYFAAQAATPGMADDAQIADGEHAGRRFYEIGQDLWRGGDVNRGIPACAACHGAAGEGTPGPSYPRLASQHASYTVAMLEAFRDGAAFGQGDLARTEMAAIASRLTDEDIQSLGSYIEGLHQARAFGAGAGR